MPERSRYIFHLQTLSGNMHHPDAKMIQMATEGPPELDRCDLQIRDHYIAALIVSPLTDGDGVFTMWDWKSGECVLHESGICSYTFLDECTPLLVVSKDDRIAFTTRSPRRPGGAGAQPQSQGKSKSKSKPKYLIFPDVSEDVAYSNSIVFHDSKLPRPESYPPASASFSRSTVPAQADHGVVALSISTFENTGGAPPVRYLVFFLREALARLFRQKQTLEDDAGEGGNRGGDEYEYEEEVNVNWYDWGPNTGRWFVAPEFEQWRCSVHGYRFVTLATRLDASFEFSRLFPTTEDNPEEPLHLLVFDFNPYPLRRHHSDSGSGSGSYPPTLPTDSSPNITVVIAPGDVTFYDSDARFDGSVDGQLACRITLMEEPADYDALAVCEDNVIGLPTVSGQNNTGGLAHIRVLTF